MLCAGNTAVIYVLHKITYGLSGPWHQESLSLWENESQTERYIISLDSIFHLLSCPPMYEVI